jgi:apolipoprotein N-acyltransferase
VPDKRWHLLAAGLAGAGAGLGHAPFGWTEFALTSFALALLMMRLRPGFLTGFAVGLGYFAVSLNWIVQPFLVIPSETGWMAPFALILMASGLALFFGVANRLSGFWGGGPLAFTVAFTLTEALRSYILTGFPWALLGHLWMPLNTVQLASIIGPLGLTVLLILPLALIAGADRTARYSGIALLILLLGMNHLLIPPDLGKPTGPLVRIVQPNFDQSQKWNPDLANAQFTELAELSVREPLADFTVWPETAFPWLYEDNDPLWQVMAQRLDAPLLTGVVRVEGKQGWNSVALIPALDPTRIVYDKHHLVPFGEYIPFPWLLERIGLRRMTVGEGYGYLAGPGPTVVDLPVLGPTLILICYEAVFPQDLATPGKRPALILHLTNDAWFGTFSGPYQHLDQVRLRAIELGLPVVRAANTGISAVIDPYGRVLDSLPLGQKGVLDYPVPAPLPATLYARTGDLPVMLLLLALVAGLTISRRSRLTA